MLALFKKDGTSIKLFTNYNDLYLHITHEENAKIFENYPHFASSKWRFEYLSPQRITELLNMLNRTYDEKTLLEAWRQRLAVVDRCEGDCERAWQTLVTPNVDVEGLREEWCEDYCMDHGYVLVKPSCPADFQELFRQCVGGGHDYAAQ